MPNRNAIFGHNRQPTHANPPLPPNPHNSLFGLGDEATGSFLRTGASQRTSDEKSCVLCSVSLASTASRLAGHKDRRSNNGKDLLITPIP